MKQVIVFEKPTGVTVIFNYTVSGHWDSTFSSKQNTWSSLAEEQPIGAVHVIHVRSFLQADC